MKNLFVTFYKLSVDYTKMAVYESLLVDEIKDEVIKKFAQLNEYLTRRVMMRVRNYEVARDILGTVELKLIDGGSLTYNSSQSFEPWICTIVSNACTDYYRTRDPTLQLTDFAVGESQCLMTLETKSGLSELISQEERVLINTSVHRALDKLSSQRRRWVFDNAQGMNYQEIAQRDNVTYREVKSAISYDRRKLRSELNSVYLTIYESN